MVSDDSNLMFFGAIMWALYLIRPITSHIMLFFIHFLFEIFFIKVSFNKMPSYGKKKKGERIHLS